ncbi:MAG: putative DNA repair protein MutK [Cognaticolwellia sp.]|jgi:predicted DNA repair protein MutK
MSGLLALLDDVAAIAKLAASSIDDIAAAAAEAGSKTAGVVIDDAAVTPKYVQGFQPERELPIIWRIAKGSLFNKLVLLLPASLLLSNFAPFLITPLLMLGGSYLCFEGAEKIYHAVFPHEEEEHASEKPTQTSEELEEEKVAGAVKTDFILSAEIMAIALSTIPESSLFVEAGALALVGTAVTAGVYGAVALIIKMDDVGLHLAAESGNGAIRGLGRGLVKGMPKLLKVLSVVGTAAMLWVGGNIVVHGLHELGVHHPYQDIHHLAELASGVVPGGLVGLVEWAVTAACDGILGLLYGLLIIPVATQLIGPLFNKIKSLRS